MHEQTFQMTGLIFTPNGAEVIHFHIKTSIPLLKAFKALDIMSAPILLGELIIMDGGGRERLNFILTEITTMPRLLEQAQKTISAVRGTLNILKGHTDPTRHLF